MALIELLQREGMFLVIVAGVLGLLIGSFLNVVIYRLPVMLERQWTEQCQEMLGQERDEAVAPFNLVTPRSRCPVCDHPIGAL